MKSKQRSSALILVLLLGATVYALIRTGASTPNSIAPTTTAVPNQPEFVDQRPLLTAQQFAKMPTTAEEKPFAEQALALGDHEMDLAFAAAVLDVQIHPPVLSAEAKTIQARLQKREDALDSSKKRVDALTAAEEKASGSKKDALDEQLDVAKAQLELDQDEVDEAKQDLTRAGGDPQGRLQTMVEEHEAASHSSDSTQVNVSEVPEARGLIHRFQRWSDLHQKQLQLWSAKHDAESGARSLSLKHAALEERTGERREESSQNSNPPEAPGGNVSREESDALIKSTKSRAGDQKALTILAKRIADETQLANVYDGWISVVAAKQRAVLHRGIIGVAFVLGILLVGLFFDGWFEHLLGKTSLDRRQVETLRAVTRVTLQVLAVLFVLLVIFGPPSQLGTVLGLAGAGLTVALKDFIVGFLGWFVLMGKNGIRLGDWVEINGVTGEVVELGMFHTVLLETGNWTDSSHPTGRRVTFTNSFAIEGHYFNFSTSGQWLWDELQVVVPTGQDPYPVVDAIQKKVLEFTAEGAQQAEREWQGAARSRDMSSRSGAPAINIRPVIGGIEIAVRYVTRANERYQLRAKLYEAAVGLLGQKARPVQEKVLG
jgi:small-conductance mechanosensitive channel